MNLCGINYRVTVLYIGVTHSKGATCVRSIQLVFMMYLNRVKTEGHDMATLKI